MKKIVSLFQRNYEGNRQVRDEVVPGAEWVLNGEGIATRKWDGTCTKVEVGKLYKRYDAKGGKQAPYGFVPTQDPDPITGHWPGWIEVGNGSEDKWFREAVGGNPDKVDLPNGTYELVGPKIQGNPEGLEAHKLIPHDKEVLNAPRTFDALRAWFADKDIEGVVWHRDNGDMVKIKKKDFGLKR
jgi:hypothetical protein